MMFAGAKPRPVQGESGSYSRGPSQETEISDFFGVARIGLPSAYSKREVGRV